MLCRLIKNSDKKVFKHQVLTLFEPGTMASDLEKAGIRVFNLGMTRDLACLTALPRLVSLLKKTTA